MKRIIFWAVLLSPAFVVLFFIFAFISDGLQLNKIDHDGIKISLERYLQTKEPTTFPPPEALSAADAAHANVYVFGESSVVLTDKLTFSHYLEKNLNEAGPDAKVTNFGIPGIDSYSIKKRVSQALQFAPAKPKVLLLYYGHNDYNVAYDNIINIVYDGSFNIFLKIGNYISGGKFNFPEQKFVFNSEKFGELYWYARFRRPVFLNLAQKAGLFKVDNVRYDGYNEMILAHFKKNTEEILLMAREAGIPVILVTPIGNLHAKPYGAIEIVDKNYKQGLSAKDYKESHNLLMKARDNEVFTGDIRAKTPLNDYLRSLHNGTNVFVFDLEKDFTEEKFAFDESNFMDYFHFNDKAHQKIAGYLAGKIMSDPKLSRSLAPDKRPAR
ncbi:MAG: hypothetical protein AABY51_00030 [Deltaproteobacteria bacterium]